MVVELGLHLPGIGGVSVDDAVRAYDTSLHLREPHLPAELGGLAAPTPADDLGMGLEDGAQFLCGRYAHFLEYPPLCLGEKTRKVLDVLAYGGGSLLSFSGDLPEQLDQCSACFMLARETFNSLP